MKRIKTKYLSLIRNRGIVPISLILSLALVLVLAVSAVADGPTYTEDWDGIRGLDSEKCEYVGQEGRSEEGWIHWVFSTKGDSTDAKLELGGTGSGTYAPGEPLNANVWHFYTPYFELEGLTATISLFGGGPGSGGGLVISDFCPGREDLAVEKTVVTSFTREHFWDIDKRNDAPFDEDYNGPKLWLEQPPFGIPPVVHTVTWTIDVTYEGYEDGDFNVSGEITIENIGDLPAVITAVDDVLAGEPIDVDCGVEFPYTLAVGMTLTCTYSEDVEEKIEGVNEVSVTTERAVYEAEPVEIVWGDPDEEINETVNIEDLSDLNGLVFLGTATAPNNAQFQYSEDFAWDDYDEDDCGLGFNYRNTAEIVETGQTADAILYVNVLCEDLDVSKTVVTTFTREHFWDIDKSVETENEYFVNGTPKIWLYTDGSGDETATWTVDVTYEGYEDNDFNVSGEITIENTGDLDAVITSLVDVLGGTTITIDCGEEFELPFTLEAGQTLICAYDEDGYFEGDNVVTVTTARDTYSAIEPIVWGDPDMVINETVNIKDISDLFGEVDLGTVTAPNGAQFTYDKFFAYEDFPECGSFQYDNTATIVETGQSSSAMLKVNVQCVIYDSAWAKGDPNVPFCDAGFSNWGWTNPIEPGNFVMPLWAGAAQCDTSKGTLVGNVTVVYDGVNVTATFNMDPGYLLGSTAVYADYGKFPMLRNGRPTVAPGQYYNASPFDGSLVHVIAHANVGMPDPNFGP